MFVSSYLSPTQRGVKLFLIFGNLVSFWSFLNLQSYFLSSQLPIVLLILFLLIYMGGLVFPYCSLTTLWDLLRCHPPLLAAWAGGESLGSAPATYQLRDLH